MQKVLTNPFLKPYPHSLITIHHHKPLLRPMRGYFQLNNVKIFGTALMYSN